MAFLNTVTIAAPNNGTAAHTADPSSASNVVAGTPFTPTAGRLLVCVADAAVTSTTPSGWTLPTGGSAINNTGLYVWHRAAAGGDTIATTHNASDYAVSFTFLEFASGAAFAGAAAATGQNQTAANPTLTGLTGSNVVFGVAAVAVGSGATGGQSMTWAGPDTELVDSTVAFATGDGYLIGIAYQDSYASTSYAPTPTITSTLGSTERITFGVSLPSGSPPVNTVAPAVTGTATQGQTLTTDNGTWTNTPTGYTYQWQRYTP
jgi:hypothetical protein